jgi:hypothetical protein
MYLYVEGISSAARQEKKRWMYIPDCPEIVATMPTPPKAQRRIIIGHTPDHVLGRIHAIRKGPQAEEPPRYEKLQIVQSDVIKKKRRETHLEPDDDEIPKSNHTQLRRRIPLPSARILDRYDIHEMEDELHRQETRGKPHGIRKESAWCRRVRMTQLMGKVVE